MFAAAAAEYCAHARLFVPVPVATVVPKKKKRSRAAVTVQVPLPLPPVPSQLPSSLIVSAVMVAATVPAVERTAIVSLLFVVAEYVFFQQDRSSIWWHSWVPR